MILKKIKKYDHMELNNLILRRRHEENGVSYRNWTVQDQIVD